MRRVVFWAAVVAGIAWSAGVFGQETGPAGRGLRPAPLPPDPGYQRLMTPASNAQPAGCAGEGKGTRASGDRCVQARTLRAGKVSGTRANCDGRASGARCDGRCDGCWWCPDDYCPKPCPQVCLPPMCGCCDDYCRKPAPCVCLPPTCGCCDDYRPKCPPCIPPLCPWPNSFYRCPPAGCGAAATSDACRQDARR